MDDDTHFSLQSASMFYYCLSEPQKEDGSLGVFKKSHFPQLHILWEHIIRKYEQFAWKQ